MNPKTRADFPLGAAVSLEQLETNPYDVLADLRLSEPVSWLPALGGWLVTRRDLALQAMRDADAFTVDDPRFTTAMVLGPSMLSLDGDEHLRHRSPFTAAFRPAVVQEKFAGFLRSESHQLIDGLSGSGAAELRTGLAGPLAVAAIAEFLGLTQVTVDEILSWYTSISTAIVDLTTGLEIAESDASAIQELRRRVDETLQATQPDTLLRELQTDATLRPDEITSAVAVLMFGAIETAEGMTTNALWHLLSHPAVLQQVSADRSLLPLAIEESLRLEPAAAFIDRYATRDVTLGSASIMAGDQVTISLLGANRDPEIFERPDTFDLSRPNARQHVAFVQGPHGCLGLHLARLETQVAIDATLDRLPGLTLDDSRSVAPKGLVFRKPSALWGYLGRLAPPRSYLAGRRLPCRRGC